jgi:hypothetical protein
VWRLRLAHARLRSEKEGRKKAGEEEEKGAGSGCCGGGGGGGGGRERERQSVAGMRGGPLGSPRKSGELPVLHAVPLLALRVAADHAPRTGARVDDFAGLTGGAVHGHLWE